MLRDPLVTYVLQHGGTEEGLVRLAETEFDPSEAERDFAEFLGAAVGGSAFAMCICSRLLRAGRGTAKSEQDALLWAEKAANTGFAPGLYELALCFELGVGLPINMQRALETYERSANGGYGFAAYRLGRSYYHGDAGSVDVFKAIAWMERAYELGDFHGAHDLGEWYESGEKLSRRYSEAIVWYQRASELGDPFSSLRLQMAYSLGELGLSRDQALADRYARMVAQQTPPS